MNMSEILPAFGTFFIEHPLLGVLLSGLIAFIESLAIVGSIVPGSIVMTIVGFMLGSGIIPLKLTLISIFIGAFIGDFISYAIGAYFKDYISNHRWVQPYQHWLMHGEAFMRKHGALSIVIGRFVGPMRSMIPMIAGIANMNIIIFTIAIIPTIILWAIVYLSPGLLLGALSIDMGETLFTTLVYNSFIALLLFSAWHLIPSITKVFYPKLSKHLASFNADSLAHLIKASTLLIALSYFAFTFNTSIQDNWYNIAGYHFAQIYTTDMNLYAAQMLSMLASPVAYIFYNISIAFVFYYHKQARVATYWLVLSGLLFISVALAKYLIYIPRPHPLLTDSSCFPSGHILLTGTFLLCLSTFIQQVAASIGYTLRRVSFIFITLVGLSRIMLQAHWLTDIFFSWLLALAIWHIFAAYHHRIPLISRNHLKQVGALIALIIIPISLLVDKLPAPPSPVLLAPITVNNKNNLQNIQYTRDSRFGQIVAPLNIIWKGSAEQLVSIFTKDGWKVYPENSGIIDRIKTLIEFSEYHAVLPIIPPLLQNDTPDITLGKIDNDAAYIVKLWLTEGTKPIYVGTISLETYPESFFTGKLFRCQKNRFNIDNMKIPGKYQILQRDEVDITKTINAFCWDGKTAVLDT